MKYFKHAHPIGKSKRRYHQLRDVNTGRYVSVSETVRRYERFMDGECTCGWTHDASIPCIPRATRSDPTRSPYWISVAKTRRAARQRIAQRQRARVVQLHVF